jgi:hypothetical protein
MGIDDKRDANEESLARRLTLVRGESREASPHRAPKLELIVNPGWKLYEALMANDPRRVSAALGRGADVNERDPDGRTPLFEAVLPWKDPTIAEVLLERGANVRVRDLVGQTPLHAAAAFGTETHLRVLLGGGAEIDARDAAGETPLHFAAGLGRIKATTFLVSRGADVSIRDHQGRTPLNRVLTHLPEDNQRELLERLLGGFVTAKVVEARSDSLILRVETFHSKYPEAERQAKERGNLTVPCGLLRDVPELGEIIRCRKGLSQALDEAWREARRRDLGIEPAR